VQLAERAAALVQRHLSSPLHKQAASPADAKQHPLLVFFAFNFLDVGKVRSSSLVYPPISLSLQTLCFAAGRAPVSRWRRRGEACGSTGHERDQSG
jgi:hypothetical protein